MSGEGANVRISAAASLAAVPNMPPPTSTTCWPRVDTAHRALYSSIYKSPCQAYRSLACSMPWITACTAASVPDTLHALHLFLVIATDRSGRIAYAQHVNAAYCYGLSRLHVCLSVYWWPSDLYKNGWADRDAVCAVWANGTMSRSAIGNRNFRGHVPDTH